MARKSERASKDTLALNLKVRLENAEGKELPEIALFLFDQNGKFILSKSLPKKDKNGVSVDLPQELMGTTLRVFVGPPIKDKYDEVPRWMAKLMRDEVDEEENHVSALANRSSFMEKRIRIETEKNVLDIGILHPDWERWLLCPCVVKGKLVKAVSLPDGTEKYLGVCNACVQIFEVDKFPKMIARLPAIELYRLRDELLRRLRKWPPEIIKIPPELKPKVWPPPPPPPPVLFEGSIITPEAKKIQEFTSMSMLGPQPEPPDVESEIKMGTEAYNVALMAELAPVFSATSATQIRDALIAKSDLVISLVCLLDWLWYYFRSDFIKCVSTDEDGRFQTTILYPCFGDKPDLYFKAWQCIGCTPRNIYDPGIACHTHWNYHCGDELVLEVTDPAAKVCIPEYPVLPPGPGLWIMPFSVGGIRLNRIKPFWEKNLVWHKVPTDPSKVGLTDYVSATDAPFGARLGFRLGHSASIPQSGANKPFYFRFQYRKEGDPHWYEFATPIADTVIRHYVDEDQSKPDEPPTFPAYVLGPKSIGGKHLCEFKPHLAPSVTGHNTYWPPDSWFADIYSGILKTTMLGNGKYQIKIEAFDQGGNRITPGAGTFRFVVPTGVAPDGVTIVTRWADNSEIDNDGFVFSLHIDNRTCSALIDAPSLSGVSAGDICGFLRYTPGDLSPVQIPFHALHPANYATFAFWIKRGASWVSITGGEVSATTVTARRTPSTPPDHSYIGDGVGNFNRAFTLAELLGPCTEAAFAEILRTYAKATNGWRRLHEYDAHHERAFALARETE